MMVEVDDVERMWWWDGKKKKCFGGGDPCLSSRSCTFAGRSDQGLKSGWITAQSSLAWRARTGASWVATECRDRAAL